MKIASINVSVLLNQWGGINRFKKINNPKTISEFIFKFDIIATQEMTFRYLKNINKYIDNRYVSVGEYRYGNDGLSKFLPFNEGCHIFSKHKILQFETRQLNTRDSRLPFLKRMPLSRTQIKRIANIVLIQTEKYGTICVINVHLDYTSDIIQSNQLNNLKSIIEKYIDEYKVILMGDFNMELKDKHFQNFIDNIYINYKLSRLPINNYSYFKKNKRKIIDHIFVPIESEITDYEIISIIDQNGNNISDHNAVFVDISL